MNTTLNIAVIIGVCNVASMQMASKMSFDCVNELGDAVARLVTRFNRVESSQSTRYYPSKKKKAECTSHIILEGRDTHFVRHHYY